MTQRNLFYIDQIARVHDVAVGAAGGQLAQRLLNRQISTAQALADLAAAVRTRSLLVLEPRVCQQMRKASRAHQVTVSALFIDSYTKFLFYYSIS
jgi:hypothetical protein